MKERPALWHSRLSHHLGPLHSILTPVLLLIGSNVSGVTVYVDFSKWPHETTLRHKLSIARDDPSFFLMFGTEAQAREEAALLYPWDNKHQVKSHVQRFRVQKTWSTVTIMLLLYQPYFQIIFWGFTYLFTYCFSSTWQSEGEKERNSFPSTISLSKYLQQPRLGHAEGKNSMWVCHMGGINP